MLSKTIVFDIDNTICSEEKIGEKSFAKPFLDIVNIINELYDMGYIIILYTSRNWCDYKMTKKWLEDCGVQHSELICGKPLYDIWVDDKSYNPETNDILGLREELKKIKRSKNG